MKQGDNICNYHAQLNAKLSSFTAAGPHLTNVLLPIGPSGMMKVDVIVCFLFVIRDMQEGDMLCGRFVSHGACKKDTVVLAMLIMKIWIMKTSIAPFW